MKPLELIDLRESIIEQATRLFVTHGYHGISMREIAEGVGVSKAALYYHFKDKEALFLATLTAELERIEHIVQEAQQAEATAREQIEQIMRGIFEQAPEQRAIIRLASHEIVHLSPKTRAEFSRIYQEKFIGQIEAILSAGVSRGELRSMNVRLATWILLGMAYPFLHPDQERGPEVSQEGTDLILSIFFDGASAE